MLQRHAVEADEHQLAKFEVDGEKLRIGNCAPFAEVANEAAGIIDVVLRAPRGRFVRVTTVLDAVTGSRHSGWYVAQVIDEFDANLLRESWAVQTAQPDSEMAHPLV